jgi:hypothetical protein
VLVDFWGIQPTDMFFFSSHKKWGILCECVDVSIIINQFNHVIWMYEYVQIIINTNGDATNLTHIWWMVSPMLIRRTWGLKPASSCRTLIGVLVDIP